MATESRLCPAAHPSRPGGLLPPAVAVAEALHPLNKKSAALVALAHRIATAMNRRKYKPLDPTIWPGDANATPVPALLRAEDETKSRPSGKWFAKTPAPGSRRPACCSRVKNPRTVRT